jgi:hypothetical protein
LAEGLFGGSGYGIGIDRGDTISKSDDFGAYLLRKRLKSGDCDKYAILVMQKKR